MASVYSVQKKEREMIAAGGVKNVESGYATPDFKRPTAFCSGISTLEKNNRYTLIHV